MPITLTCDCGRTLKLRDELAGKRIKCPSCRATLKVPDPEVEESGFEIVETTAASEPNEAIISAERMEPRRPPRDDDERPRPRKRRKKMRLSDEIYREFEREERRRRAPLISISPAVVSGALAMIGAVVWFVLGLFMGWIFFYPPILFVLGLIVFVRGLMGCEEE